MQKNGSISKNSSLRLATSQSLRRLGFCSQISTAQQTSPVVFPEKRSRSKAPTSGDISVINDYSTKAKGVEHKIDIGDEQSDLLGYEVFSGKLSLDKRGSSKNSEVQASEKKGTDTVDAKLTSKALIWGSDMLLLEDVVSLSYCVGFRHFTLHAYPLRKGSCGGLFIKSGRSRKDHRFLAPNSEDALQWVNAFADQQCFVNCLPHPMASKNQSSEQLFNEFPPESYVRCKSRPKMLVILNPRSGRGRSSKVFHGLVEPIFKLSGFDLEVVNTTAAGHAKTLAASVDFSTCPDGIICVGGDGIVNEVLNGLLSRDNQKEAISVPIGIIPAGSDNSLVWTVLGVRDPISAAIAIVKGGLTATDVFAVEWIHNGDIHFGMTVAYFGFISDVLELSDKYQKRFGPFRYFVAGFLKFLCLPKYSYEVEYLPAQRESGEVKIPADREIIDMSELYTNIMRKSSKEGLPRASSLSSIDSIMTPSQMSGGDLDAAYGSTEPSEYVRAIDPKSKRLSVGRSNLAAEPEVMHSQMPHTGSPNWPRTRSKSRTDKGWAGLTITTDNTRSSCGNTVINDREDISSTISDPGPIWDAEPRWDTEPNWEIENPIEFLSPSEDLAASENKEMVPKAEETWVQTKGQFLALLVCNHSCRTVQSLSSQVVAPKAEHDDNTLDLLLVRGSGRLRLLRFLLNLQRGRHITLPYVEYTKVKSVKVKPGKRTHNGSGIDGELFPVNGQVICSLLPEQCRLIGRSPRSSK